MGAFEAGISRGFWVAAGGPLDRKGGEDVGLNPEQLVGEMLLLRRVHRVNPCYGTREGVARDWAHGSGLLPSAGMKGISPFS